MDYFIVYYILWFVLLFLVPVIIFYKKTRVTQDMINLKGLNPSPQFDDSTQDIIKVNSDFDNFLKSLGHSVTVKNNFAIKTVQQLCDDAKNGRKVNPNAYIVRYKELCDKFVAYILLFSFLPLAVSLRFGYWDVLDKLFLLQVIGSMCVLWLKRLSDSKIALFSNCLYTHWYDKIANFDFIAIKELRPVVLNALKSTESNNLLAAIAGFAQSDLQRCDVLSKISSDLSAKLDEFIKYMNGNDSVTWQDVVGSFDDTLKTIKEIGGGLAEITTGSKKILPQLTKLSDKKKIDVNTLNGVASQLQELKQMLINYKSEAVAKELEHLESVSLALEKDIGGAYRSIETTITENTSNLNAGYDKFFEICEKFNHAVTENYEESIIKALNSVNTSFSELGEFMTKAKVLESSENTDTTVSDTKTEKSPAFTGGTEW